jgi:hypothetical protein
VGNRLAGTKAQAVAPVGSKSVLRRQRRDSRDSVEKKSENSRAMLTDNSHAPRLRPDSSASDVGCPFAKLSELDVGSVRQRE